MSSKSLTIRVDEKLHADLTIALIRRRAGTIKDLFYSLVKAWLKNPDILTDYGSASSLAETVRTHFLKWVGNPYSIPREWGLRFETLAHNKMTPEEFAARLVEMKTFFDEIALSSSRMQDLTAPGRSLAAESDSPLPPVAGMSMKDAFPASQTQQIVDNTVFSYFEAEEAQTALAEKIADVLKKTLLTVPGEILLQHKSENSVKVSLSGSGTRGRTQQQTGTAAGDTAALLHESVDRILASGQHRVIRALTHNVVVFEEMVDLISKGHPDDHLPSSPEDHPGEKTAESRPAAKRDRKIA